MQRKKHKLQALIIVLGSRDIKFAQLSCSESVSGLARSFCAHCHGSSLQSTPGATPLHPIRAACLVQMHCRHAGLPSQGVCVCPSVTGNSRIELKMQLELTMPLSILSST